MHFDGGMAVWQVVDFQWNPHDPWTMMSVSDEAQLEGGGTLQLWRVSDLLHRSEEDVLAELEKHRFLLCYISLCWGVYYCNRAFMHQQVVISEYDRKFTMLGRLRLATAHFTKFVAAPMWGASECTAAGSDTNANVLLQGVHSDWQNA
jgi:hypothetical protein